jgi:hypothetical protein
MTKPPLQTAVPLDQAVRHAPALVGLVERIEQSSAMLRAVRPLIPPGIEVKAGSVEDQQWCLLVSSNAAAAKLRQLLPALSAALRSAGWPTQTIRIKVMS